MIGPDEVARAAERIKGHTRVTPVVAGIGGASEMKLEQLQHTGSFKPRGAFNTLIKGPVPKGGVVAASGGNHGAAVAYAASRLGHSAHIFVPEIAGPSKIALIERTGAQLTVVQGAYANALEAAQAYEAETGAMQVHAYDAEGTVAGQGTVMAEWEAQGLDADTVLIAVGGGGLIAGALAWLGGRRKVVAVESEGTATLHTALAQGPDAVIQPQGVAANALGAARIGQIAHGLAVRDKVTSVTVSDDAITRAQAQLWQETRQLVEPAGATALAALTSGAYQPMAGERVAVLVCGGNIAPDPLG